MAEPLVSIVIATRDRPALLERAIQSILRQTLGEIEIVVIDDGSGQSTLDAYGHSGTNDQRVSYHQAAQAVPAARGISEARNHGLSLAQAPYVVFFDDDDEMATPGHLEMAVDYHKQYPRCLYFGDLRSLDGGRVVEEGRIRTVDGPMIETALSTNPPIYKATVEQFSRAIVRRYPHFNAALLDTALTRELGGFSKRLFLAEDVNLFLRYADRCSAVIYRREAVVDFDVTPRPRAFDVLLPPERELMAAVSMSMARIHLRNPHLRRTAAAIEACMLASAAAILNDAGKRSAARLLALQSLSLHVTKDGLRQAFRSLGR
jgi:glycosyltransferase involved in cell wall biosynthesis